MATPTPAPAATSSRRRSPIFHPRGWRMLKSTTINTVKHACPTMKLTTVAV